jgi:adenylate cyclase
MASLAFLALCLWLLGYPDQALKKSRQALALDQEVSHPASLAFALIWNIVLHQLLRDVSMVQKQAEALKALSSEQGFPLWSAGANLTQGWILIKQDHQAEGLARMLKARSSFQAAGSELFQSHYFTLLAEAYGKMGETDNGLVAVNEALIVSQTGERTYKAEIHRLRGELLLKTESREAGLKAELSPEGCFLKAIEVARAQQARSLELRATVSLCRLWQEQGRCEEARQRLAEIYGWFTEGFDTADLIEAKALLERLV